MKRLFLGILALFFHLYAYTQSILKANEAVELALKNNYNILIARNEADIDKINNSAGNAGMLPSFNMETNNTYSLNTIYQELSSGNNFQANHAYTNSFDAGIGFNWTVFDGGKMFVTKNKLQEIEEKGAIIYKEQILQLIHDVTLAYYDVVRQKQQLSSINEVITYNLERVKLLEVSFGAGLTPKTNLLQAKIDLNVYQENAISQKNVISLSKRTLNQFLSREANQEFEVEDSIPCTYQPDFQRMLQLLDSVNTAILANQHQVYISGMIVKEYQRLRMPKINISGGYDFSLINNETGSVLKNRNYGPSLGATLSLPLFQGGNLRRQINTAKIDYQSAQWSLNNTRLQINTELQNAITTYQNQVQLLSIEKDNVILARENLEISMQRLRYGQTTSLEVREAQDSYEQSLTRLVNFKYNLKVAETRLKQLMSEL